MHKAILSPLYADGRTPDCKTSRMNTRVPGLIDLPACLPRGLSVLLFTFVFGNLGTSHVYSVSVLLIAVMCVRLN
jgi:hypothetical protein